MSLSLPLSDILTEEEEQELLQGMGSDHMKTFLTSDDVINGPYHHDIYNSNMQEETALCYDDYKPDFGPTGGGPPGHFGGAGDVPALAPLAMGNALSNEEYPGPYDFEVTILPNYKAKNPWVFSAVLNKVFMDMGQQFPVDFKILNRPGRPLFIRITPQYSAQHYAQDSVHRCIQHSHHLDPTNKDVPELVTQHVIRCTNKHSQYLGSKELRQRLSIAFPFALPQIGSESVREIFYFVCKSSCPTPGMNRRSLEVIFTLEDEMGEVLGRKCLNVRICACPKRDKEKEEKEHLKEKSNGSAPKGKKRKSTDQPAGKVPACPENDLKEYGLNLKLVGKHVLQKVLAYAEDVLAAEMARHQGQSGELLYKKNLQEVQSLRGTL